MEKVFYFQNLRLLLGKNHTKTKRWITSVQTMKAGKKPFNEGKQGKINWQRDYSQGFSSGSRPSKKSS